MVITILSVMTVAATCSNIFENNIETESNHIIRVSVRIDSGDVDFELKKDNEPYYRASVFCYHNQIYATVENQECTTLLGEEVFFFIALNFLTPQEMNI
jgi:hypothetical protein